MLFDFAAWKSALPELLIEKEPETSYIDHLYVVMIDDAGKEHIIRPKNRQLRYQDGEYLVMKKGDKHKIEFESQARHATQSYQLVAKGYYYIDNRSSN
jgi:hypothetical protein